MGNVTEKSRKTEIKNFHFRNCLLFKKVAYKVFEIDSNKIYFGILKYINEMFFFLRLFL